jgi:hypothetical protein
MNETIALFPLQIVVFPDEDLNLHIFEPRYKQLIRDCVTNGIHFGINAFMNQELQPIGTEVKLITIEKEYDNGELDIRTRAVGAYRLEDYFPLMPGKLYAGGTIKRLSYHAAGQPHLVRQLLDMAEELFGLYEVTKPLPDAYSAFLSYQLAHYLGLNLDQEYQLLCMEEEDDRLQYLIYHILALLPAARDMKKMKDRIRLNGHFKHLVPPGV